jgi:phosphoglucosamine mutase
LAVLCRKEKPLSELTSIFDPVPQTLLNVQVKRRQEIDELTGVMKVVRAVEEKLGKSGRVLVRFSGTEPKARVLIEGSDRAKNDQYAKEIAAALSEALC